MPTPHDGKKPRYRLPERANLRLEQLEDRTVPAVIDWVGDVAGNNNWGANVAGNTNWAGNVLPGNGDVVRFATANAVGHFLSNNDLVGLSLNGIVINRAVGATNDFTLTGNAFTLGSVGVDANIGFGESAIRNDLTLSAKQVFRNSGAGDLKFRGTINLNSKTLIVQPTDSYNFEPHILFLAQSVITGAGAIVKAGSGFASIDGNNNFTGETRIAEGVLVATHNNALGATGMGNETYVNYGSLYLGDGGDTIPESVTLAANTRLYNTLGSNTHSGNITTTGDASIVQFSTTQLRLTGNIQTNHKLYFSTIQATDRIEVSGAITGSGQLVKDQPGELLFTGGLNNAFQSLDVKDGTVTLSRNVGTNVVGSNSSIVVSNNGVLRSTAASQISDSADVELLNGGRLELNNVSETIDTLAVRDNAVITTGSGRLVTDDAFFYGSANNDQFYVGGTNAGFTVTRNSQAIGSIAILTSMSIDTREGTDLLDARGYNPGSKVPRFTSGIGDDTIIGTVGNDWILNLNYDGVKRYDGQAGNDLIVGGIGHEYFIGGDGNDTLSGGLGNDTMVGGIGDDSIAGSSGSDVLQGEDGNDTLYGNADNDFLKGGIGVDLLFGGSEVDRLQADFEGNLTLTATLFDLAGTANDDVIDGFELAQLYSGSLNELIRADTFSGYLLAFTNGGNDTIVGSIYGDYIDGGIGDDSIVGREGNDTLYGQDGNDVVDGQQGNDFIYGGNNNDTVIGGDGNDIVYLDLTSFGEVGNDVADVGVGDDIVYGGAGNDTIIGGVDDDTIYGEDGNDLVQGDDGHDLIEGNNQDDTLLGNAGDDTLDGGLGTDIAGAGSGINVLLNFP